MAATPAQELEHAGVLTANPLLREHVLPVPAGDESLEGVLRWASAEYSATDAIYWSHVVQVRIAPSLIPPHLPPRQHLAPPPCLPSIHVTETASPPAQGWIWSPFDPAALARCMPTAPAGPGSMDPQCAW